MSRIRWCDLPNNHKIKQHPHRSELPLISAVEVLKATSQLGNRHVAGEHTAFWPEELNGVEYPGADLVNLPIKAEDAFHPENL